LKTIDSVKNVISGVALATLLWTAPASLAGASTHFSSFISNQVVASSVANAKEMASGTGSRVNKDPESLLRYGLPIDNKEVRTVVDGIFLFSIFQPSLLVHN
jgi:hypothetical protein